VWPVIEKLAGQPTCRALKENGIGRLILAPNHALHLFPLHACLLADGRNLADACEVVYTPSLSILHQCVRRERRLRRELLLVENPTLDLPFTEVKGNQLRAPLPHAPAAVRRPGDEGPAAARRRPLPRPQLHRARLLQPARTAALGRDPGRQAGRNAMADAA
jgi:hypothetical protein